MITKGKDVIEKTEQPREKPRTCRKLPDKLYHILELRPHRWWNG